MAIFQLLKLLGTISFLIAGANLFGSGRRRPHDPTQEHIKAGNADEGGHEPREQERSKQAAPHRDANNHPGPGDERQQRYERRYWIITGTASVVATLATVIAAGFAIGAYNASLDSVAEARKQVVAAEEGNKTARRALAAAIGASVHVGPAEFRQLTQADNETKINIIVPLGNDGGTTTRGLTYAATCLPTLTPAINPYDHRVLDKEPTYNLTLSPKETVKPIICSYGVKEWGICSSPPAARRVIWRVEMLLT